MGLIQLHVTNTLRNKHAIFGHPDHFIKTMRLNADNDPAIINHRIKNGISRTNRGTSAHGGIKRCAIQENKGTSQ